MPPCGLPHGGIWISTFWRKPNFVKGSPEKDGSRAPSHRVPEVRGGKIQKSYGSEGKTTERLEFLFSNPSHWWDDRRSKESHQHRDFRLNSRETLWLSNFYKSAWVESQLAMWDAQVDARMRVPHSVSISGFGRLAQSEGDLEFATCRKLCENGQVTEAADALSLLVQRGCHIPSNLFYCVLKRCIVRKDLVLGRRLHALTVEGGYEGNAFLATQLIGLYASHGRLEEAMQVLYKLTPPSAYNWAALISAYARHGEPQQAIRLYGQMLESTVKPTNHIFVAVLNACATAGDLAAGKEVHAHICASAVEPNIFVHNCLVDMYAKCGNIEDARRVFDRVPQKNVVTWNSMIGGYAQQGKGQAALSVYSSMQQEGVTPPDSVTFACLLQACASVGVSRLHQLKQLHAQIEQGGLQHDVVVGATLVSLYSKCGSLDDARKVFDTLRQKNVVTWNAMIAGYAQQGMGLEALNLYSAMRREVITPPDSVTFACLLRACASAGVAALHQGKQLHEQIEQLGVHADGAVNSSLVNMYAKCGSLEDAQRVFDRLSQKDVVTWNAMITGYAQNGMGQEALRLYSDMQKDNLTGPDAMTFASLLQACATVGVAALKQGQQLHAQIVEQRLQDDVVVGNSLVTMYGKCGSLEDAHSLFDRLSQKNVVTWTAMIAGYAQQGLGQEALSLYSRMQQEGITPPNSVTFVCLLQACASVAALQQGKHLHAQIEERGLQGDMVVGSSLVNMYAKCGSLEDAQQVFDSMPKREIVAWSALIAGYAREGNSEAVFDLVQRMWVEGIQPNGITFLSVLTVCSHVGLVDEGRKYFKMMSTKFGIVPTIEHYRCMMDLLGRAGYLDDALEMGKIMPFQPNGAVWRTLLGACQKWSNVEIGRQAFEFAVRLDEKDGAAYVLMSNIYADAQMWEKAKEMQERRVNCGAWKEPGRSWTDMGGVVHSFVVGDREHSESEGI